MELENLEIIPLDTDSFCQYVRGFHCGNEFIDSYLNSSSNALTDQRMGITSTSLVLYHDEIVAYYTANCSSLTIDKNEAKEIGLQDDLLVPALEVKFLGVEQKYQGKGIGDYLIKSIIGHAYKISKKFACRYVFLWSVPEVSVISFYQRRFFTLMDCENDYSLYLMRFLLPKIEYELSE